MISKQLVKKNIYYRRSFDHFVYHHIFFKSVSGNLFFSRKIFYKFFEFFMNYIFYTKIYKHCLMTYRRRGILNYFCLSRMMFKYYAVHGYLSGVQKLSW
uniref:40S ribosomal protein S14 n=1 Tax=Pleurostomum flabellatum TaxID=405751 RepID=A0A7T0M432_9EUKA|nr:40S ribosomal protein S14 [Pleurostomum flabellatum]QPL15630.1 40S ribosomal protein S14 [Pleurostomum flabellatum]